MTEEQNNNICVLSIQYIHFKVYEISITLQIFYQRGSINMIDYIDYAFI